MLSVERDILGLSFGRGGVCSDRRLISGSNLVSYERHRHRPLERVGALGLGIIMNLCMPLIKQKYPHQAQLGRPKL